MNEYLTEFRALKDTGGFRAQTWFGERQQLVEEYSWAIPNDEALSYIADFDDVLEIGAGNGYWAHCLERRGCSVRATDIDPPDETWTDVEAVDVTAIPDQEIEDEVVLTVWPPLNEGVAADVATRSPSDICYVGERRGGCTASDEFFVVLDATYELVEQVSVPSYHGIHDELYHYTRSD